MVQANRLAVLSTARNKTYLSLIAMKRARSQILFKRRGHLTVAEYQVTAHGSYERLGSLFKSLRLQVSTLALRIVIVRSASVSASSESCVT